MTCALWMIGEGLTEKKPVFNIPCLFGSKYVRRIRSRVHANVKQDEANTRRKNAKKWGICGGYLHYGKYF